MSKCKRIILTIIIALLGIGLEVVNYYVFALNDRFFEIGVATAGLYIASISVIGNIMFNYYYSENKKEK